MNLEVCGHRVLIKAEHLEEVTESGIVLNVGEDWKREKAATVIGIIVSVGPTAWKDFSGGEPWANVGDKVYYARYSGKTVIDGDDEYVIVNDEDIQCVIQEDKS